MVVLFDEFLFQWMSSISFQLPDLEDPLSFQCRLALSGKDLGNLVNAAGDKRCIIYIILLRFV